MRKRQSYEVIDEIVAVTLKMMMIVNNYKKQKYHENYGYAS